MDLYAKRSLRKGLTLSAGILTLTCTAYGYGRIAYRSKPRRRDGAVTVDRLTCSQAQQYVRKNGMYWLATSNDGPIPITFVSPFDRTDLCNAKEGFSFHRRSTLDNASCVVGITCRVMT